MPRNPESWWDGRPFDRILADVPCSASGVVRRHPDAKWLRRETDIAGFAATQKRIIDALWRTLAPGGTMLYASCSVFAAENERQVDAFLGVTPMPGSVPGGAFCRRRRLPDTRCRT
jgi:16S rRNA (cytosine967-C5)-methyltransferase